MLEASALTAAVFIMISTVLLNASNVEASDSKEAATTTATAEMSFLDRIERDLLHNQVTQNHVFTILESMLIGIAFLVVTGVAAGLLLLCAASIRKMIVRVGSAAGSKSGSLELPTISQPTMLHPVTAIPAPANMMHPRPVAYFHHGRPPPRRLRMNI